MSMSFRDMFVYIFHNCSRWSDTVHQGSFLILVKELLDLNLQVSGLWHALCKHTPFPLAGVCFPLSSQLALSPCPLPLFPLPLFRELFSKSGDLEEELKNVTNNLKSLEAQAEKVGGKLFRDSVV